MSFYEKFKPEVEKIVAALVESFSVCKSKLALTEKRLNDQTSLLDRLNRQKDTLTSLADESLADDINSVNSFDKFKTSLRKVNADIESTSEAVEAVEGKIIPVQRRALEEAQQKLETALEGFCQQQKNDCETSMNALLSQIIELQDDFYDFHSLIFTDYGLTLKNNSSNVLKLKHKRITTPITIDKPQKPQLVAIKKIAVEPVAKSEQTQTTPAKRILGGEIT
jgi:hypothetical protein